MLQVSITQQITLSSSRLFSPIHKHLAKSSTCLCKSISMPSPAPSTRLSVELPCTAQTIGLPDILPTLATKLYAVIKRKKR